MSAPTGAQAAADLAATRCNQVVGSHMPGCPHIDWTRPVRVLTRLESVGNPFGPGGSFVVHGLGGAADVPGDVVRAYEVRRSYDTWADRVR